MMMINKTTRAMSIKVLLPFLLKWLLLVCCFTKTTIMTSAFLFNTEKLTPEEFFNMKDSVNVVVDVRTQEEWDDGHIEGATLVESLDSDITQAQELKGCEYCEMIVYCRTGNRASKAIKLLRAAGFKGTLYNGQGVSQWEEAGYPLVFDPSMEAPCTTDDDVCPST